MQTIKNSYSYQFTIKHSKFIGFLDYIDSTDNVKKILDKIEKKYKDSTHVVYAYILFNGKYKFSDANEPPNSAGKPVYNILSKNNLFNNMITVIRYFGGIKLGIGGLIRAYSHVASELIKDKEKSILAHADRIKLKVDYKNIKKLKNYLSKLENIRIVDEEFGENIVLTCIIDKKIITSINQRREIIDKEFISSSFFPF